MKRTLLFVLTLAVIPVGVDAQDTPSDSCGDITGRSPLEDVGSCADQGDANAQYILGYRYANGWGVLEDDAEAIRLWRLAAEQGFARAQLILGRMYFDGRGVPEDIVLAYMWSNLAAAHGDLGGQTLKDRVEQQMTREQIGEAQRMSREWLEAHPPGSN